MTTQQELSGRTAVVTGASSGIGRAIAKSLAASGATVYLTGRSAQRLDEVTDEIVRAGGKAVPVPGDLRDLAGLDAVVDRAVRETGSLDIFVNNAGLSLGEHSVLDSEPEQWREMFEVNVIALLAGSQAAIRAMRAGGRPGHVVNLGSIAAKGGSGVYGATKAAVAYLNEELRRELEDEPIRVVHIVPGTVLSNFGRTMPPDVVKGLFASLGVDVELSEDQLLSPDFVDSPPEGVSRAFLSPDDVARAVLYAVTQPSTVNVYEIEVRPQVSL